MPSIDMLRDLMARDVLENFLETCPPGYWVDHIESVVREDDRPTEMTVVDAEDGDSYRLTVETIVEAFERVIEEHLVRDDLEMRLRDMWDSGDYCGEMFAGGDFETDDVIVQIACFGTVQYG